MNFPDLRAFIEQLRHDGDLVVVEAPVDARLEAAEIHRRVIASGGPALLFTNIEGADFPLVTNLFGTVRRAEMAFGSQPFQLVSRAVQTLESVFPPSLGKLWQARDLLRALTRLGTRFRRSGPILETVSDRPRLDRLPVLTCWPEDGGPFVTLPLVYSEHPEKQGHNLGMYRLQVFDRQTTGVHWQIGKGGGFHYAVAESRGESLPLTVYLGGPPALILAAIAPLPENLPELLLASLIAGEKLPLCAGPDGRRLIASAEFALMGEVPPHERRPEGPFGDHYGYYSLCHDYPVFRIKRLAHRRDAIFPATVVGKPRQEDFYIGDLLQELLSPLFPFVMPAVQALWSYGETGFHSLAAAVVRQRFRREAVTTAFRILGEGQLALTKFLLVTDQPVDLKNFPATLQHILERTHLQTDLYVLANLAMDTLDYTGPAINEGSKAVWLGLGAPHRQLPREFKPEVALPTGVSDVRVFCPGCLVVEGPSHPQEPELGTRLVGHPAFKGWPLLVLTEDAGKATAGTVEFLWSTFTRFEPAADIYSAGCGVTRHHICYREPILFDARLKPGFPAELRASEEIANRVTQRWREYFPAGMEMGDTGDKD